MCIEGAHFSIVNVDTATQAPILPTRKVRNHNLRIGCSLTGIVEE
jgi:hypothetical protein